MSDGFEELYEDSPGRTLTPAEAEADHDTRSALALGWAPEDFVDGAVPDELRTRALNRLALLVNSPDAKIAYQASKTILDIDRRKRDSDRRAETEETTHAGGVQLSELTFGKMIDGLRALAERASGQGGQYDDQHDEAPEMRYVTPQTSTLRLTAGSGTNRVGGDQATDASPHERRSEGPVDGPGKRT